MEENTDADIECFCRLWQKRPSKQDRKTIYQAFRPLAIITWTLGLLPVKNIIHGPYGSRNYFCCVFSILAFIATVLPLAGVIVALYMIGSLFANLPVMDQVQIVQLLNRLGHSVFQYLMIRMKSGKISSLLRGFYEYDKWVENTVQPKRAINVLLCRRGWLLAILTCLMYVAPLQAFYYFSVNQLIQSVIYHIVIFAFMINMCLIPIIPTLHVLFLGRAITLRLKHINISLASILERLPKGIMDNSEAKKDRIHIDIDDSDRDVSEDMSEVIGRYAEMSDLVSTTGDVYGVCIMVNFMSFLVQIITGLAGLIYRSKNVEPIIVVDTFVSTIIVVWICIALHDIPEEAFRMLPHLNKVKLNALSPECRMQVQEVTHRMMGSPIQMSAANFFSVNRGLITSIAATVITYLIVLAQFKGAEVPADAKAYPTQITPLIPTIFPAVINQTNCNCSDAWESNLDP